MASKLQVFHKLDNMLEAYFIEAYFIRTYIGLMYVSTSQKGLTLYSRARRSLYCITIPSDTKLLEDNGMTILRM